MLLGLRSGINGAVRPRCGHWDSEKRGGKRTEVHRRRTMGPRFRASVYTRGPSPTVSCLYSLVCPNELMLGVLGGVRGGTYGAAEAGTFWKRERFERMYPWISVP
jgi:hypothetical protein